MVYTFFPSLCLARADLILSQFQNVRPSDMHRLYSLQGLSHPLSHWNLTTILGIN